MILNGWFRWFIVVRNVGWNRRVFASLKSPISPRLLVNQRVFIAYSFISKTLALNCSQMRPNTKLKVWNTRSEKFFRFYAKCTFRLSQQSFAAFLFVRMQNKNRLAIAGGFSFNILHSHVSAIRKLCKKKPYHNMANSIVKPSMLAPQHANVGRFLSPSFLCYLFLPQRNFVCEKFTESNLKIETRGECFSRLVTDNKEQTSLPQNVEFIGFTLRFNKAETFFISRSEAKNHASHYFYISIEQGKSQVFFRAWNFPFESFQPWTIQRTIGLAWKHPHTETSFTITNERSEGKIGEVAKNIFLSQFKFKHSKRNHLSIASISR